MGANGSLGQEKKRKIRDKKWRMFSVKISMQYWSGLSVVYKISIQFVSL